MNGITKWFNLKKGYGFIEDEEGNDYFVHWTNIETETEGKKILDSGDKVEFEVISYGEGKTKAGKVVKL